MTRALLVGYYGYANPGDEALLEVLSTNLRSWGCEVAALTGDCAGSERDYGVKTFQHKRLSELVRAVRWADVVILGGGGLLQDATSPVSIWYYLAALKLAESCARPVIAYAQGVGPLGNLFSRSGVRRLLRKTTWLSVRDEGSRHLLGQLGLDEGKIELVPCPTLLLEPAPEQRVNEIVQSERLKSDLPWLAVSLRGTPGLWWKLPELAEGIRMIAQQGLARPVLVPFQRRQDEEICWQVRGQLGQRGAILKRQYLPSELLGLMGRAAAVLATRLHALLFAANQAVPVLALPYDMKVSAAAQLVGAPVLPVHELESFKLRDLLRSLLEPDEVRTRELSATIASLKQQAEAGLAQLRLQLTQEKTGD